MPSSHAQPSHPPSPDADPPQPTWPDARLLACVAGNAIDPTGAHAAFTIFLRRWRDRVCGQIHLLCQFQPAQRIGADHLEAEVWFAVFRKAGTYDADGTIDDTQSARTAGWLKSIVNRALRMGIRRLGDRFLCTISDAMLLTNPDMPPTLPGRGRHLAILARCLQRLSERDADVLRTSAGFITTDGSVADMPAEVRDTLLRLYETTEANLRQIRHRALMRLTTDYLRELTAADPSSTDDVPPTDD